MRDKTEVIVDTKAKDSVIVIEGKGGPPKGPPYLTRDQSVAEGEGVFRLSFFLD
jgi:hypothetical protein